MKERILIIEDDEAIVECFAALWPMKATRWIQPWMAKPA